MTASTKTVVFIDPNVADWQDLVNGVEPGSLVFILDPQRDGIRQITDRLATLTDIDSVQIISHGGDGSLQLGSSVLNSENLNGYSSQLQQWGKSLTATGDILLYGCDVAQGFVGKAFVQQISQLTGADVAASDDLTGSAVLGGDWVLEYATGLIEAPLALQVQAMEAYTSVLPDYVVGGYIGSWNLNSNTPTSTPFNKLTHLFYSFANVNADGTVTLPNDGDAFNDITKLQQIKAQNPNLKIMLSIGGAIEPDFRSAVGSKSTETTRTNFVNSAIKLMNDNGFDGIDLDWEGPESKVVANINPVNENPLYINLLNALNQGMGDKLLTTALYASNWSLTGENGSPYNLGENLNWNGSNKSVLAHTSDIVDFINVMAYDYRGSWTGDTTTGHQAALGNTTTTDTVAWAVNYYINKGVDLKDIVLGIPLYGRDWTGVNAGATNGLNMTGTPTVVNPLSEIRPYNELYPKLSGTPVNTVGANGYGYYRGTTVINGVTYDEVPHIYNSQLKEFITYEDTKSVQAKTNYVKNLGLGGAFFWETPQDLPVTNPDSLINVAATNLGFNNVVLPSITLAVSFFSSVAEDGNRSDGNTFRSSLSYTFTRTGATTNALTVNYGITGTADSSDYTGATPGTGKTITFAAGASTATLTIYPTPDTDFENDETVLLTLASGTGYTIGTTTAVTGTITNDDSVVVSPSITLAVSPSSVTEDGTTNLIYTFTRTGATTNALTVNYGIAGTANSTDYTGATPGTGKTITFAAGASTATLTINPTADTTVESDETVLLTLASGTGYTVGTTTAVTGTITNDDGTNTMVNFGNIYTAHTDLTLAQGWTGFDKYPRQLADVNGDGRADIIAFGYDHVFVSIGKADGTFAPKITALSNNFSYATGWTSFEQSPRQVADVNGDGYADIVGFSSNEVSVALGNQNGVFGTPKTALLGDFVQAGGWNSFDQYPRQLADVNGDGRADIVGFG
ncbi:glycosyl hydrolase family 18 protein, partial [Aphanizomenon sp. UHCC 0183]|uniref:glycosyl hydrolase family 18 protein n=1 Tax=Aphanizomenon sp. UHCC 0183 TaxID=2590028 RepID=UPI001445F824